MMTARSAVQFSLWLAVNHPDIFADLYRRATKSPGLGHLGDDSLDLQPVEVTATYSSGAAPDYSSYDYSPDLSTIDVTPQYIDQSGNVIDQSSAESLFNLPPIAPPALTMPDVSTNIDTNSINQAVNDPTITQADPGTPGASAGGSFLSSLGQGIASATSTLLRSAGTVAAGLTNPTSVKALAGAAQAYFTSQAQSTALQTQLARANAGLSPAPITYGYNAAGQLVPMMANPQTGTIAYNAQGQPYYVTPQVANGLMPGITTGLSQTLTQLTPYLPYLIGGAALLFLVSGRSTSGSSSPRRPRRSNRSPRK